MESYSASDFMPLAAVFIIAGAAGAVTVSLLEMPITDSMMAFMGTLLLQFGGLKAYNREGFVNAFTTYDLLAARSKLYAKIYPFIELSLAFSYLLMAFVLSNPVLFAATNVGVAAVMLVGVAGVLDKLREGETVRCACMGDVFRVPMTWVTFLENFLMAGMAVAMLVL